MTKGSLDESTGLAGGGSQWENRYEVAGRRGNFKLLGENITIKLFVIFSVDPRCTLALSPGGVYRHLKSISVTPGLTSKSGVTEQL